MQMTMDAAIRPGLMQAFALNKGSGYVMRSEKRPGYGSGGSSNPKGRKPKRPRAGIFYILLTILVCVILWPIGLVMLWSRRVRMQAGTKLLISLLTLCVSVFLIVFTLTVPVDNPKFTAFQDKANDWLNHAAADAAVAGDAAYKKGVETWSVIRECTNNAIEPVANTLADGVDKGVDLAVKLRAKIENKPESDFSVDRPTGVGTDKPDATAFIPDGDAQEQPAIDVRVPENTPDPDTALPLSGGTLSSDGTFRADATPKPTSTPKPESDEATDAEPAKGAEAEAEGETEAVVEAEGDADTDSAAKGEAMIWTDPDAATPEPEGDAEAEVITAEADADGEAVDSAAEADAPQIKVKAAADATVYYNKNGRLYHKQAACKNMNAAPAHTLTEALAAGKQRCSACDAPDAGILEIEHVAWVDEKNVYHTTDECARFSGSWTLISLEDAVEKNCAPCPDCGAEEYTALYIEPVETPEPTPEVTEAPTAEPTETPEATGTPEPTDTPEPTGTPTVAPIETVTPSTALKPAGDATVYHSSNGKFYHRFKVCKGMSGSRAYKLSDITARFKRCKTCDAPDTAMVGQTCLWVDDDKVCHTSDECKQFKGNYQLVPRDDALKQGLTGCPDCGADEYLIPNTVLAEAAEETEATEATEKAE